MRTDDIDLRTTDDARFVSDFEMLVDYHAACSPLPDFEEAGDMTVEERTMLHSLLESIRLRRRRGAPVEEVRKANDDLQGFINIIRKKGNNHG